MGRFDKQEYSDATRQQLLASKDTEDGAVIFVKERKSAWTQFASFFTAFVLGVIATSMVFGLIMRSGQWRARKTFSFAKTDALPHVPMESVTFEMDPIYSAKSSDDSDYAWNSLLPLGRGYVYVDDGEARGLLPGQFTEHGDIYSVAMYHQIHCLARIRKMFWIFEDALITGELGVAKAQIGRTPAAHASHCFDYLRQAIQCNGDMTLEWPKQDGPSKGAVVDGWGVSHTCKSPTAINDFMDKYHYNMSIVFDAAG